MRSAEHLAFQVSSSGVAVKEVEGHLVRPSSGGLHATDPLPSFKGAGKCFGGDVACRVVLDAQAFEDGDQAGVFGLIPWCK